MRTLFHRLRGAVGNGIAWGVAWIGGFLAALGVTVLIGVLTLAEAAPFVGPVALSAGVLGLMSGVTFSVLFGALNRRQSLRQVSAVSTALLGAAAGSAFPASMYVLLWLSGIGQSSITVAVNVAIGLSLGAGVATGSLRLAQAKPHDALTSPTDREVLPSEAPFALIPRWDEPRR